MSADPNTEHLFEDLAEGGIGIVRSVYNTRGHAYGDTWRNCQWNLLRAKLTEFLPQAAGLTDSQLRIIALSAYVDMKYSRGASNGPDHLLDMVAYSLALIQSCELEARKSPPA